MNNSIKRLKSTPKKSVDKMKYENKPKNKKNNNYKKDLDKWINFMAKVERSQQKINNHNHQFQYKKSKRNYVNLISR